MQILFFIIVMICINHASSNLQGGLVCSDWGICLGLRKTKFTISSETSHLVLCYNSQLKTEINCEKKTNICMMPAGTQICLSFKVHDLITCLPESSSCCFPRVLVN